MAQALDTKAISYIFIAPIMYYFLYYLPSTGIRESRVGYISSLLSSILLCNYARYRKFNQMVSYLITNAHCIHYHTYPSLYSARMTSKYVCSVQWGQSQFEVAAELKIYNCQLLKSGFLVVLKNQSEVLKSCSLVQNWMYFYLF